MNDARAPGTGEHHQPRCRLRGRTRRPWGSCACRRSTAVDRSGRQGRSGIVLSGPAAGASRTSEASMTTVGARTDPDATRLRVGDHDRSTPEILTAATHMIAHHQTRPPKPLAAVTHTRPPQPPRLGRLGAVSPRAATRDRPKDLGGAPHGDGPPERRGHPRRLGPHASGPGPPAGRDQRAPAVGPRAAETLSRVVEQIGYRAWLGRVREPEPTERPWGPVEDLLRFSPPVGPLAPGTSGGAPHTRRLRIRGPGEAISPWNTYVVASYTLDELD